MIPQFPKFKKLELSDREEILNTTKDFPPYSDFNFVSMFSWNTDGFFEISKLENNLVIRFTDYIKNIPFLTIIGLNNSYDITKKLFKYADDNNLIPELRLVTQSVINGLVGPNILVIEDRDNFDYVYSTELLANMKGGSFETKRNLINRFHKFTPDPSFEIIDLRKNTIETQILNLFSTWKKYKQSHEEEFESDHELRAIKRLLSECDALKLKTFCLYSNQILIGFSIFELLNENSAICHFAKINQNFTGAHDFIMKEHSSWLFKEGITTLNYEQDLGIESLRHSKLSFRPVDFLKKYRVIYN